MGWKFFEVRRLIRSTKFGIAAQEEKYQKMERLKFCSRWTDELVEKYEQWGFSPVSPDVQTSEQGAGEYENEDQEMRLWKKVPVRSVSGAWWRPEPVASTERKTQRLSARRVRLIGSVCRKLALAGFISAYQS